MAEPWFDADSWGCVRLKNVGAERGVWRLDFEGVLGEGYTFWVFTGDRKQQILKAPVKRTMNDTQADGPWMASHPFAILPGETIELRVLLNTGAWFGPTVASDLPNVVPEQVFDEVLDQRFLILGAQLAACLLLIAFFVLFSALLQSRPARYYAYYFIAATLTLIAYYGLIPHVLPSHRVQNVLQANRYIEIAMMVLHMCFITAFVRDSIGAHRILRLAPWLIWSIPVSFGLAIGLGQLSSFLYTIVEPNGLADTVNNWLWSNGRHIYPATVILAWSTLSIWSVVLLLRRNTDGAWFFAAGTLLLLVSPCVQFILTLNETVDIFTVVYFASTLGLVDAIIFAGAIVRLTFGLRSQRDTALQEALAASEEKLKLSQSLLSARENLDTARDLAEQHRSRLALTGHDLRQPLLSLRLALDKEDAVSPTMRASLNTSLSYLKSVLDQVLSDTRPSEDETPAVIDSPSQSEPIPLQIVLQNAGRMFQDEAQAKELELRIVDTSAIVAAEPVALIRMVSNLVSNAVKYTQTGRVLLGVRKRGETYSIEVHDTGPGLTTGQIADIQQSYHRSNTSDGVEGEGIGLASVQMLADEHSLSFAIQSQPGAGSCFAINGLPAMRPGFADTDG